MFLFYLPNKVTSLDIICAMNNHWESCELFREELQLQEEGGKSLFSAFFCGFVLTQTTELAMESRTWFQIKTVAVQDFR